MAAVRFPGRVNRARVGNRSLTVAALILVADLGVKTELHRGAQRHVMNSQCGASMPAPRLKNFHQQIRSSIEDLGLFGEPIRRVNISFQRTWGCSVNPSAE